MKKKTLWLTRTALMLALLMALQWVTKPLGQVVTGSCVNAVLAITCLTVGLPSGLVIALISPVLALWLGIAPNPLVVPAIMTGNALFVSLLAWICGKNIVRNVLGLVVAAFAKFSVMYALVSWFLLETPKPTLLATFSWPQLVTALIGGTVALLIVPVLKKALQKSR